MRLPGISWCGDLVRLERGAPGASGPHAHLHGRRPKVGHRGRCCLHALPLRCVWQANFPHGTGARATSGSAVCYRWQSRRRMGADGWAAATRSGERLSPPGADTGSGECASASLRLRCGARPPVAAQVAVPRGPLERVRASAEWSKSCVEVKIAKNFPPPAGASGGACGELPPTILPVYITAGRRRPESSPVCGNTVCGNSTTQPFATVRDHTVSDLHLGHTAFGSLGCSIAEEPASGTSHLSKG